MGKQHRGRRAGLCDIEDSNKHLIGAFNSANCSIAQLNTEISQLQQTSQLNIYYAKRMQTELEYMNRMNFFAGKYDDAGFFLKRPPV